MARKPTTIVRPARRPPTDYALIVIGVGAALIALIYLLLI